MAEDQGKEEEKFDFTPEGEGLGYISLDEARLLAIEHAQGHTEFYGSTYVGVPLVWEVLSAEDREDYYEIKLSFRPPGRFRGQPGIDQFIFDKTGGLRVRQMLDEPTIEPTPSRRSIPTTTPTPKGTPLPAPGFSVPGTYEYLLAWGSEGTDNGQFRHPDGVAADEAGNIYIRDGSGVQVFDEHGGFLRRWGTPDGGIAVDGDGNVYLTDRGNSQVQVFNESGEFLRRWGREGNGYRPLLHPRGIAVDQSGTVYVADTGNHLVQVFNTEGEFLRNFGGRRHGLYWRRSGWGRGDGELHNPYGVAVDQSGNAYVADTGNRLVQVFDADGEFQRHWGTNATGGGRPFKNPCGIALDVAGNVYVADTGTTLVQAFESNGRFLRRWGGSAGVSASLFESPRALAVGRAGKVYVADENRHQIHVFSPR